MSLDTLFDRARHEKLRIGNLVEGTNGTWHCYAYRKSKIHGVGFGESAKEALELAINGHTYIEREPEPAASQFADLLG